MLSNQPIVVESYQGNLEMHSALKRTVQDLVNKAVLEEVVDPQSPGYYGRLFLRPKSGGRWRSILDLTGLNDHIQNYTFHMETAQSIQNGLRGCFALQ